jgi:hypothetical protein
LQATALAEEISAHAAASPSLPFPSHRLTRRPGHKTPPLCWHYCTLKCTFQGVNY